MYLNPNSLAAKWFVWWCDHFTDFVTGDDRDAEGKLISKRKGAYYLERGTTLCHIFWAAFWFPLIVVAAGSFVFLVVVAAHLTAGESSLRSSLGVLAYVFPELVLLGSTALTGVIVLALLGAARVGLLAYLKALKRRICPVVTFISDDEEGTA